MKVVQFFLVNLCLILPVSVFSAESAYQLNEGDTLKISVWGEETLNHEINVLPDGSISFPLVGSVNVNSMTAPQVAEEIKKRIKTFIPDPHVSVVISSTAGNRVYVLGKVNNPGAVAMHGPMSVIQVLSISGGLGKFADEDKIRVIRYKEGKQQQLKINYGAIMSGSDLSTNHQLMAGDTILVP